VRGEEINAETCRSDPGHCCTGECFAYAALWNRLPRRGNSMQTVRKAGQGWPAEKLTWGARGGSTVNKVLGSGEPEATGFPGVAVAPIYVVLVA
jgi:hypothetical protein